MKKYSTSNSQARKKHLLIVSVTGVLCPSTPKLNTRQHLLRRVISTQKNFAMDGGDESVQDRKRENGTRMEESENLLEDDKEGECLLNDDNAALECVRRKLKHGS